MYQATVHWQRNGAVFTDNQYSREHTWQFDGGITVPASSSPHVVPLPMSLENAVDPEEALIAAASSCHMLWFLGMAAKQRFCVESYIDEAVGVMGKGIDHKEMMTTITLNPIVTFCGEKIPTEKDLARLHHLAHENCYIANSLKTEILINIR